MSKLNGIQKLKNNVHRSSFDLSFRNAYTAKVGEILPICVKEVLPGDKFKLDLSQFTRTQPLQTVKITETTESDAIKKRAHTSITFIKKFNFTL